MEGTLHPANVLMCPHTCITNLPKPREVHPDVGNEFKPLKLPRKFRSNPICFVGPASVIVGNLVQGNRLASATGRDVGGLEEETSDCGGRRYQYISEILRWRNHATPDHVIKDDQSKLNIKLLLGRIEKLMFYFQIKFQILFTLLSCKGAISQSLTCSQLHKKAERIGCLLVEKVNFNLCFC